MLNNLTEQLRECHRYADLCGRRASVQTDSQLKDIYGPAVNAAAPVARTHPPSTALRAMRNLADCRSGSLPHTPSGPAFS
jgi:hypothetical protein